MNLFDMVRNSMEPAARMHLHEGDLEDWLGGCTLLSQIAASMRPGNGYDLQGKSYRCAIEAISVINTTQ